MATVGAAAAMGEVVMSVVRLRLRRRGEKGGDEGRRRGRRGWGRGRKEERRGEGGGLKVLICVRRGSV